ncbi:MAG: ABC transporter ATP-binding protein [Acidobacteriia bacterium]|nr:ABC transporter ATP-binding protein [Terriglobia bacterium]
MAVIEFHNASKSFSRVTGRALLRNHLASWLGPAHKERFYALKHVTFRLEQGESLAVIGPNGAGKSTLLALVAGLTKPDQGAVYVGGRVAALLELGSGFHHDLTGAENVWLNAALLGLSRKRTLAAFDEIVDFSGIGEFINEPLRTYSAGMIMRLAFSVAVHGDPEIMLIDEVLSVGDQSFQKKSTDKIRELRAAGKTLVCVSHVTNLVQQLCDRAIWLDGGEVIMNGTVDEVLAAYSGRKAAAR